MLFLGIFLSDPIHMEVNSKQPENLSEKDKDVCTPLLIRITKSWLIRVIFYTLVFLVTIAFLYQQLVIDTLEIIRRLNVPENSFIWSTFRKGIIVGYLCSYIPLAVFYFFEFAWCEVYTVDNNYEIQRIETSKKIRFGIGITALLIACSIPYIIMMQA